MSLGIPKRICEDNIKVGFIYKQTLDAYWTYLVQDKSRHKLL
jgi:hypothetical protein